VNRDLSRLHHLLEELSRAAFSVPWYTGIEWWAWSAIERGPCVVGRVRVEAPHIQALKEASSEIDGWILLPTGRPAWIPIYRWRSLYGSGPAAIEEATRRVTRKVESALAAEEFVRAHKILQGEIEWW
jgi:hypothetical protein